MELYYLTFLSIMLMGEIHSGASNEEPLQCYSCISKENPECAEHDTKKLKAFETQCDANAIQYAMDSVIKMVISSSGVPDAPSNLDAGKFLGNGTMTCLKAEYAEKDSKKVVMRFCSILQNHTNCQSEMAKYMKDVSDLSCKECEGNLCNDSTVTAPSSLLFVTSLISCFFALKQ